jgi:hypothetical protein
MCTGRKQVTSQLLTVRQHSEGPGSSAASTARETQRHELAWGEAGNDPHGCNAHKYYVLSPASTHASVFTSHIT